MRKYTFDFLMSAIKTNDGICHSVNNNTKFEYNIYVGCPTVAIPTSKNTLLPCS